MKLEVYGALERCPQCKQLKQYLDSKFELYSFMDVDKYPTTRQELNIKSIPVLILRDDNGTELKRVTGFNQQNKHLVEELLK